MIAFALEIEPVAKGRPRFTRQGRAYTPRATRAFEQTVRVLAAGYAPLTPLRGPVRLDLTFVLRPPLRRVRYHPTVKPDLDNLQKGVTDALNGLFWLDDAQVIHCEARKVYDWVGRKGFIQVRITPLGEAA